MELVLIVVELLRQLIEQQALRRVDQGDLAGGCLYVLRQVRAGHAVAASGCVVRRRCRRGAWRTGR
ncbi:gas vesicle protein GvpK [Streptomyces himastatinicus]|uniref:gas vesicle protein GvpK n=1 Tax=Streptomyces himastatinicus TaxID=998084 RepID=UPI000D0BDB39